MHYIVEFSNIAGEIIGDYEIEADNWHKAGHQVFIGPTPQPFPDGTVGVLIRELVPEEPEQAA